MNRSWRPDVAKNAVLQFIATIKNKEMKKVIYLRDMELIAKNIVRGGNLIIGVVKKYNINILNLIIWYLRVESEM